MTLRTFCLLYVALLSAGCARHPPDLAAEPTESRTTCLSFYRELDETVFAHGVEDSGEHRPDAFPQMRSNRFLASFAHDKLSESAYRQWLELMRRLDQRARLLEFANLPGDAQAAIVSLLPKDTDLPTHLYRCGRLLNTDLDPERRTELADAVAVPDNYTTWQRVVGLYPLARLFADAAIDDLHEELAEPFLLPPEDIPATGRRVRYRPEPANRLSPQQLGELFGQSYDNPLRILLIEGKALHNLFLHFAPVWDIDERNDNDANGAIALDDNGRPKVDSSRPTVYVKTAHTRYRGDNLLQLVYQIWFPEREKTGPFDLYGGELDSVIWRVTLNRRGEPIAYDSIHACGCYYLLFPGRSYRAAATTTGEPVLSPARITALSRLSLGLSARTHYLQQVSAQAETTGGKHYRLMPYRRLRSLPVDDGRRRNLFGAGGIIESSARTERFVLWPFGVESPGAMRQWGSHAIAFVGRRHFDDADLLEKLLLPETPDN